MSEIKRYILSTKKDLLNDVLSKIDATDAEIVSKVTMLDLAIIDTAHPEIIQSIDNVLSFKLETNNITN